MSAAAGVLLALDKGEPGEAYNLGGQITTMRELMTTLAELGYQPRGLETGLRDMLLAGGKLS